MSNFNVKFIKSKKEINWDITQGSILELAESIGLTPESNCRIGTCATCEVILKKGSVEYEPEPFVDITEGKVLLCCSTPTSDIEIEI